MAGEGTTNIIQEHSTATSGLNLDQTLNQIQKGQLTYALNAAVANFDSNSINYQNEPGNEFCLDFPEGFLLIGSHFIQEKSKQIFFLANPDTAESEIGYMDNNDCVYRKYINAACLNFNVNYPIHKIVHKITNCSTEIYWTDGLNARRFMNLDDLPYAILPGSSVCLDKETQEIDCNKLKVQPNFSIPQLTVIDVVTGGNLTAGTYQFAIQYCDVAGDAYTSYYSVTNPTPIANTEILTPEFNYPVGKSIELQITNIDVTGYFQYYNLAVIKTVNAITSVQLVGTYAIDQGVKTVTYTGQNVTQINLTIDDIFEKFPYYDIAQDLTAVQDVLVWDNLTSIDRINYQKIANQITLQWQSYKLPTDKDYSDELVATNLRGYMRDEVYAFEIVFLLKNGQQTDGFHIPGRTLGLADDIQPDVPNTNPDFIGDGMSAPYWKIYNTATVIGDATGAAIDGATPYKYGEFAYWESTETYPCNTDVWGYLANQPIRHHKFPDVLVSPVFESGTPVIQSNGKYARLEMVDRAIFPIGVRVDIQQIETLISFSDLTPEQKQNIAGFKIVRGDRSTNRSIVAKGILRNVGKYNREGTDFYFPNYPYNDLREDPFLLEKNNAYNSECLTYIAICSVAGFYQYTDCFTNAQVTASMIVGQEIRVCSLTPPVAQAPAEFLSTPNAVQSDSYRLRADGPIARFRYIDAVTLATTYIVLAFGAQVIVQVEPGTVPDVVFRIGGYTIDLISEAGYTRNTECYPNRLDAFNNTESPYRQVFNSPDTSFGQPFLGNVLKLENVIFGAGSAHFVQVKDNAFYKLLTREAQQDALASSERIANVTGDLNPSALFAAYQSYLQIYINGITRKNYGYSYNSRAEYNYWASIDNDLGIKQRQLDIAQYLIPGVQSVGDNNNLNNFQRESSVYIKTIQDREDVGTVPALPYPSQTPSLLLSGSPLIEDASRFIASGVFNNEYLDNCSQPEKLFDISTVCYYGSIKNIFVNQWGQMYSYETIDTGFQKRFDSLTDEPIATVFGGDTFINKFSFKTKLPFFIENRVGALDDSDVFYDEIGNVAYPEYWHSSRSILYDYLVDDGTPDRLLLKNIISIKAHNFDCPNNQLPAENNPGRTFYDGKMYMFAYGIPTFYCESTVNVDLRQAFNTKEGDFYPHVSTGIPDEWFQQTNVPIAFDNTYYYNPTFSKQNKENFFSHLPVNWDDNQCFTNFPFRAIYSDRQQSYTDNRINSWLIYRPISFFDFPQNYGNLVSLDGIQNRAVLARFENKSLLYNTLLTVETSNPQAAYLGNDTLFRSAPPIDFAETDLGYVGSQNKMLLKIPQGQITIDAKRGQVFLIAGNQAIDLSVLGTGMNRFFTDRLSFEILRYFPDVNIDNHFNGVGLHGVYDSKYDRIIITKLDYIPINKDVKYDDVERRFYINKSYGTTVLKEYIELTDRLYFCNRSWTLSYNLDTKSWISFHSYLPNFYIGENNYFYSGLNQSCELEAIAAEENQFTPQCSLAGTISMPNCTLAGTAELINNCGFSGTAQIYIP